MTHIFHQDRLSHPNSGGSHATYKETRPYLHRGGLDTDRTGPSAGSGRNNANSFTANPLSVALLRWYEANHSGASFPIGSSPGTLAFDGSNTWISKADGTISKLRASDGALLATFSPPTDMTPDCAALEWQLRNRLDDAWLSYGRATLKFRDTMREHGAGTLSHWGDAVVLEYAAKERTAAFNRYRQALKALTDFTRSQWPPSSS